MTSQTVCRPIDTFPQLCSERDAAKLLAMSYDGLRKMRIAGRGPRWIRVGRRAVSYEVAAIHEWIERRTVQQREGGAVT